MDDEKKAFFLKAIQDALEKHMHGFYAEIKTEVAEAVRMLRERQEAENVILWANFDALAFFVSENAGIDHDSMPDIIRKSAKVFLDSRLTKLENTAPEFAARVQAWADGNFPSFPFGEPLPEYPPPEQ